MRPSVFHGPMGIKSLSEDGNGQAGRSGSDDVADGPRQLQRHHFLCPDPLNEPGSSHDRDPRLDFDVRQWVQTAIGPQVGGNEGAAKERRREALSCRHSYGQHAHAE